MSIERWDGVLKTYEEAGYLTARDGVIELTRDGLLQVDRLLKCIFSAGTSRYSLHVVSPLDLR